MDWTEVKERAVNKTLTGCFYLYDDTEAEIGSDYQMEDIAAHYEAGEEFGEEKDNDMYIVVVSYSFDSENPVWIFDTEQEAIDCIRKQFEEEKRIEIEENERVLGIDFDCFIDDDGHYAKIKVYFGNEVDVTEWSIGDIKNR